MVNIGINVLWISKTLFTPGNVIAVHTHEFFHYLYVLRGAARITIDGQEHITEDDQLYPIPAGHTHSIAGAGQTGLHAIQVKFTAMNGELARGLSELARPVRFEGMRVRHILESLVNEAMRKGELYKDLINVRFLEVLLLHLRASRVTRHGSVDGWLEPEPAPRTAPGLYTMESVLTFMEKNVGAGTHLETLARICGMSKYHFCRHFKELYGISPMRHLNRLRLARAKELMLYSEMNIRQIAYEVGFEDANYFSRIFQQSENMSPSEYCRQHRDSLYLYLETDGAL
jgi:AraC-like DNA-binding protein